MKKNNGFTLIELMITIVVTIILSTLAMRGYQAFMFQAYTAAAEKEIFSLAYRLEGHRSLNWTYAGFAESTSVAPRSNDPTRLVVYDLTIVDLPSGTAINSETAGGYGWAIRAIPRQSHYPTYLMNSWGEKCKSFTTGVTYLTCGAGSQAW